MDLDLRGKKALVTGASRGLGLACATQLASEGVDLAICGRDSNNIASASQEIRSRYHVKTLGISADVTVRKDLERATTEAEKFLGQIDILVVSTGHPPTFPFSEATEDNWKTGLDLLLWPAITLSKLTLDKMRARKFGRIVFIGSIFGIEPEKSSAVQSTIRTGLNAMAKCLATEVAADGVTVNVICPGYFETPLVTNLAAQYASSLKISKEQVLEDWKNFAPVQQFGKPEDLGALVCFLASPKAAFITGTAMVIDGGAIRQY
jgi:3-oxoacyl-[acyl-carrier protein] reductase